jgi:hypothetical protein
MFNEDSTFLYVSKPTITLLYFYFEERGGGEEDDRRADPGVRGHEGGRPHGLPAPDHQGQGEGHLPGQPQQILQESQAALQDQLLPHFPYIIPKIFHHH